MKDRSWGRGRGGTPPRGATLATLLLLAVWSLACLGCAGLSPRKDGRETAAAIARQAGLSPRSYEAGAFTLKAFEKTGPGETLMVYIEGDGNSWLNRLTPSKDPTPTVPLALSLAAADPSPNVLYLARPCQYLSPEELARSPVRYWTGDRYAPEVVEALSLAIDAAKRETGAARVRLVGFSGGGAMAALLCASRDDVEGFMTLGGNLDIAAWTTLHGLSPLSGSLNPADRAAYLAAAPQTHLVGEKDAICPQAVARSYLDRLGPDAPARLVVAPGLGHADEAWAARWPEMLREYAPWNAGGAAAGGD